MIMNGVTDLHDSNGSCCDHRHQAMEILWPHRIHKMMPVMVLMVVVVMVMWWWWCDGGYLYLPSRPRFGNCLSRWAPLSWQHCSWAVSLSYFHQRCWWLLDSGCSTLWAWNRYTITSKKVQVLISDYVYATDLSNNKITHQNQWQPPTHLHRNVSTFKKNAICSMILDGIKSYGIIRHPIYTFTLLGMLATPLMTYDRLLLTVSVCLYLLWGVPVEEKKLIAQFGPAYSKYFDHSAITITITTTPSHHHTTITMTPYHQLPP